MTISFEFARMLGSDSEEQCIKSFAKITYFQIFSDFNPGFELDSFLCHLIDTTLDMDFVEFEIWNAVYQQTPKPIVLFKYRYLVTNTPQLLSRGQSCRSRADHSDLFPGFLLRWLR